MRIETRRRPARDGRHGRLRRGVALLLSWVFTASTIWAAAPPPVAAAPAPAGPRPAVLPGLAAALAAPVAVAAMAAPAPDPNPAPAAAEDPPPVPSGCEVVFWGPRRFTRTRGKPNVYTETVSVPAWVETPHLLQVTNGRADGGQRISSAEIRVNGEAVAVPSDFSPQVAGFERSVVLTAETTLEVELASKPDSFLLLGLCGVRGDETPPVVTWTDPTPATSDTTPRLALTYDDPLGSGEPGAAGVDPESLVVTLDDVDRTALFTRRPGDASAELPADLALDEGLHTLVARVRDHAGNEAEVSWTFWVDVQAPSLDIDVPEAGTYLAPPVTVRVTYADESELAPASLRLEVNGTDLTVSFDVGPTEATATLDLASGLVEGANRIEARVLDQAANEATASVAFNVDITAPTAVIAQPAPGSRHGSSDVEVTVQYQDDQALDPDSLVAQVDGTPITLAQVPGGANGWLETLVEGEHALVLEIRDAAGNLGTARSDFLVDTEVPTVQVVQPSPGAFSGDATPSLLVTYSDAHGVDTGTLSVRVNGEDHTDLLTVEPETAYGDLVAALSEGGHTALAEVGDLTGNVGSATSSFTVDTVPPSATLEAPATFTHEAAPAVTLAFTDDGSGVDPAAVRILVDGTDRTDLFAVDTSGATGILGLDPALADGPHEITVEVADRAGNLAAPAFSFTLDTAPPLVDLTPAPDAFVGDPTPTLRVAWTDETGSGVDTGSLRVFLRPGEDPEEEITDRFTVGADEATAQTDEADALADGTWRFGASVSDRAGNVVTTEAPFLIDTVPPTFTVEVPTHGAVAGTATPAFDIVYADDASGVDPESLALRVDGIDRTDRLVWDHGRATGALLAGDALVDGEHALEVTVADRAGNVAPTAAHAFHVDTVPPTVTVEAPLSFVGSATPLVRVAFSDGGDAPSGIDPLSLVVEIDGIDHTAALTVVDGVAEGTLSTALADGPHAVAARVSDVAGHLASDSASFSVDTQPPALSELSLGDGDWVAELDAEGRLQVSGMLQDLDPQVSLSCRSGGTEVGAAVSGGQFTCHVPLTEGDHTVELIATDRSGNSSTSTRDIHVDLTAPTVTILDPEDGDYTSATTLGVSGTVVDGSPAEVEVQGVAAAVSGQAFVAIDVPVGDEKTLTLRAVATDAAGHTAEHQVTVTVDRVPPDIRITWPEDGVPVPGPTVEVQGTFSDESPVSVVYVNEQEAVLTGGGTPSGTFSLPLPLSDGTVAVEAKGFDAAGNEGTHSVSTFVDSVPPVLEVTAPLRDTVTSGTTLAVAGTATDAAPVALQANGQALTVGSDGAFSGEVTLGAEDGPESLVFSAVDTAGNSSTVSIPVVIDRTAPALEIVTPADDAVVGSLPVVVQGTVADATATTVTVDGEAAEITGSAWTIALETLLDGPHTFTAVATDAAGNTVTRTREVTLDLEPPVVVITAPEPGTLTAASAVDVSGTVSTRTPATVSVNGITATVTGDGFVATAVPLVEGENTLTAEAVNVATQRTGQDSIFVTRDTIPPVVTLAAPETISRDQPGRATATAADSSGVARVEFRLAAPHDVLLGELTALPFEVDLVVPEGARSGDSLTVTATAFDLVGNAATATRGVRVATAGVVVGRVLDDATSLPLADAQVSLVSGSSGPSVVTDERGRYRLPTEDDRIQLTAEAAGFTSVSRDAALTSGVGNVLVDARLTPLAEAVTVGSPGGTLSAAGMTVTVPAGTVGADTGFRLTPLSTQGLPGLLPLGFSPLVALDLRTVDGAPVLGAVALTPTGLPDTVLHLVAYRFSTHAWHVVAPDLVSVDETVTVALPQPGAYALVAADPDAIVPEAGQDLVGVDMAELPEDAASRGEVVPSVVPPGGGTAEGRLVVQMATAVPSGTVIQAEITETYHLASGDQASEEPRLQDIVVFRHGAVNVPADPQEPASFEACAPADPSLLAVCAHFPITPSRTFSLEDLAEGQVHLDILAGREAVRGKTGGIDPVTLESEDVRLSVAGGSLAQDTVVALEATEPSSFLPATPGVTALREAVVDLSGASLSMAAELSMDAALVPEGGTLLLARVERLEGVPRLVVVSVARRAGARVVSQAYPGLPGIREEGRYVFLRVDAALGFVSGVTSSSVGPEAAEVGTPDLPFVFFAGNDGAYIVPAAVGPDAAVEARVPGTSLAGGGTVAVAEGQTSPLDLALSTNAATVTVAPAHGAVSVPVSTQVEITSSSALDAATVTGDNLRLLVDGVPVAVRFVLSGTARRLAVVPAEVLAFSTVHTLQVSGLVDVFGSEVVVPPTSFTTRDDVPPVYDVRALTFSFPDETGLVQVTAPPDSFPSGTSVLVINSGNGVVVTLTALNDGSVAGELPASIDDQMMVTLTDPLGNVTTFTRSEFRAPDGRTAVGAGGGVVVGEGGVELRIPAGALEKGVVLKVEAVDPADVPADDVPAFATDPPAELGSGLRITSEDSPVFEKEADLVFPVPEGASEEAFFHVYRQLRGPDGKVAFETLDHAFLEGEGEDARVVTASPPFSGYLDMAGSYTTAGGVGAVASALNFVVWTHDDLKPGQALTSVVTGKVLRVVWDPGATTPTYEPVPAGTMVVGADAAGTPLLGTDGSFVARTQADGTYALVDGRNVGGTVQVAASVGGHWRTATVYEMPLDTRSPNLGFYTNVFTANITFPAVAPPPPPPAIDVFVMQTVGDQRQVVPGGLALVDVPLIVGFRVKNEGFLEEVTVQGQVRPFRQDSWPQDAPLAMDYVLDAEIIPDRPGTHTITARALPPVGPPVIATRSFRVIAAGGGVDTLPDDPPAVIGEQTSPPHGSTQVPVSVFPQVAFSEPVRNVLDHVRLIDLTDQSDVELFLSGVGPDDNGQLVTWDPIPDALTPVTSITLQPRGGLKYGTRYRIVVQGGVEDLDRDALDDPAPKTLDPAPFESEFTTYGPELLTPAGSGEDFGSPGLVRLGTTAYLIENLFLNGQLRAFDVSNPVFPELLDLEGQTLVYNRPVDIAGEGHSVVVATGPTNQSKPSNLAVFDVTDAPLVRWVGAAGLTNGVSDGFVFRIAVKDGLAYASTYGRGIQVVDLAKARGNFQEATGGDPNSTGYWGMIEQLTSDGQQFGPTAIVMTVPVAGPHGVARLYDLKVADAVYDGQSQALVAATGDAGLVLVNPQAGAVVSQGFPASADGLFRLDSGSAVAVGWVADHLVAVVGGAGLVGGDPPAGGSLAAVVDLSDPAAPTALGFVALPESPVDMALQGDLALASGTERTYLISLTDLTRPFLAGPALEGLGGRLSVDPDSSIVLSTAESLFGGSEALGGLRTLALTPGQTGACPLLTLPDKRVVLDLTLDPLNETLCGTDEPVTIGLCEPATVSFTVDGVPLTASVDGGLEQQITDLALSAGPHTVRIPAGLLGGVVSATRPFVVEARSVADPALVARETGTVEADLRNRSVLPVGHTFVKGVDLLDGHVVRQSTDLQIPGRHLGLNVTRSYSSAAKGADGAFGAGWSFNYGSGVFPSGCAVTVVTTPDGSSQSFRSADGGQTFTPQKGYHTTLVKNGDDSYDFTDKSGTLHHFREPVNPGEPDRGRRLDYVEEPHGDRIEVTYDGQGRVAVVAERHPEAGVVRRLHFDWTRAGEFDRVQAVESDGPLALRVEYEYDEWGNLLTVRRAGSNVAGQASGRTRVESHTYSAGDVRDRHQMLSATDPNGARVEYEYYQKGDDFPGQEGDPWRSGVFVGDKEEFAREVRELPSATETVTTAFRFDYTSSTSGIFVADVTDALGHDTRYTLNGNGSPTLIEEPLGKTTQLEWATDDIYKIVEVDTLGRRTTYGYDDRGNLTRETIETTDFGAVATEWEYETRFNKLVRKRDAEGRETLYAIDGETGDLLSTTDPVGNVTRFAYDGRGRLTSVTDPRGNPTQHGDFDSFGNARTVTDPLGNVTTRAWDVRGRLVATSDTLGRQAAVEYDAFDRPARETRTACADPCETPAGVPASDDAAAQTTYYPDGQPRLVRNPNGAEVTYELDGMNRVVATRTVLPGGDVYSTSTVYDGNGNKTRETDRRGVERLFAYDALNRLERVEIVAGSPGGGPYGQVAAYGYDLVGNKKAEIDVMGETTRFVYDDLYRVEETVFPEEGPSGPYKEVSTYDKVGNRLTLADANGHTTTWEHDGLNRVVLTRNALGQETTVTYLDPEGSRVNKTEEHDLVRGLRTTFGYDALNREARREHHLEGANGDGAVYVTTTVYEDASHAVVVTDPRASRSRTHLDGLDRPILTVVDEGALDLETALSYDGLGNRKALRDPRGLLTQWTFDGLGRQTTLADALGNRSEASYDGEGLKQWETDRRGVTTTFEYDSLGRPTREALQPSLTGVAWSREIEYQDLARRRIERDARGHATTFDLDRMGRVVVETDPRGFTVETVWDGKNRREVTDKRGQPTSYEYDALDRVTSVRNAREQTVVTEYRDAENATEATDRRRIVARTETDPLGRVTRVLRPWDRVGGTGIAQETSTWDGNGNRTSQTDAEGQRTDFAYDGANRLVRRTDGVGTPAHASVDYRYDASGNRTAEIDERHTEEAPTVRSSYDGLNRLASTTNGEGETTLFGYDAEGNRTSVQEPKGPITRFTYGERGELLTVTEPAPAEGEESPVTTFAYDQARNRISQRDANGALVEMGYDELNRVTSRVQDAAAGGLNLLTLLEYDPNGNETLRTDPKGQTVTSTYDELNRLETTSYAFADGETEFPWRHTTGIAYDYDENDNLIQIDESVASGTDPPDRTLTTTRSYDELDRLESETTTLPDDATRTVSYAYFDNGTRRSVTDPDGVTTAYTYDGKNRLATATTDCGTPKAKTTTYAYFPDDLLRSVTSPNGVVATHAYDLANRLTSLTNARGETTVSLYEYGYDDNGNRLTQVEANGGLTESTTYAYDALDRLKSVTYPVDSDFPNGRQVAYSYDAVGNRVGETTTLPGQPDRVLADKRGIFDSLNRLTELEDLVDPSQTHTFGWDANGNQTTRSVGGETTLYVYDVRDKLVEAQGGGGVLGRFQYDFAGRRNLKVGESGLRQYVYDETSLFAEYDSVGVRTAKYDYGSDRLLTRTHQTEGRQWFSLDGLRSVVNLTDDAGSLVASYHLDAWGNFRFPSELDASRNRFVFTGHIYDSETGLYNAKARYFDPKLGRFLTQDSFLGEIDEPPSLHRYLYGYSNPLRYVDPTGHAGEAANPAVSDETIRQWEEYAKVNPLMEGSSTGASESAPPTPQTVTEEDTLGSKAWGVLSGAFTKIGEFNEGVKTWVGDHVEAWTSKRLQPKGDRTKAEVLRQLADQEPNNPALRAAAEDLARTRNVAGGFQEAGTEIAREGAEGGTALALEAVEAELGLKGAAVIVKKGGRAFGSGARAQSGTRAMRSAGGVATGGRKLAKIEGQWLRGSHGNAGVVPGQIAAALRGKRFRDLDHFREEFWKAVAADEKLARQFSAQNVGRMKVGYSPRTVPSQQLGEQMSYILHHRDPIHQGGGVLDLDNIMVVTPRYHKEVLDPSVHFVK